MKFRTLVELGGKTATGLRVPADVVAALGSGRKPAVVVTIAGYTYRSTVASMGGAFMIPLSAEHRAAVDTDAAALAFFDGLSYSNRRRIVGNVEGAKTPEPRQRRLDKAVVALSQGRI